MAVRCGDERILPDQVLHGTKHLRQHTSRRRLAQLAIETCTVEGVEVDRVAELQGDRRVVPFLGAPRRTRAACSIAPAEPPDCTSFTSGPMAPSSASLTLLASFKARFPSASAACSFCHSIGVEYPSRKRSPLSHGVVSSRSKPPAGPCRRRTGTRHCCFRRNCTAQREVGRNHLLCYQLGIGLLSWRAASV